MQKLGTEWDVNSDTQIMFACHNTLWISLGFSATWVLFSQVGKSDIDWIESIGHTEMTLPHMTSQTQKIQKLVNIKLFLFVYHIYI